MIFKNVVYDALRFWYMVVKNQHFQGALLGWGHKEGVTKKSLESVNLLILTIFWMTPT